MPHPEGPLGDKDSRENKSPTDMEPINPIVTDPSGTDVKYQPVDKGLPSTTSNKGTTKTMPHPEGPLGDKDSRENKPPTDMEPINPTVTDPSGEPSYEGEMDIEAIQLKKFVDIQALLFYDDEMVQENKPEYSPIQDTDSSTSDSSLNLKKFDNILPVTERQLVKYLRKVSIVLFNKITETQWAKHEEVVVSYAKLKASIKGYYEETINKREKTDKVIDAAMNSLDKNRIARGEKFKKAQDVEHQVLKRQHSHKAKRAIELRMKRVKHYIWTMPNRLKPEPIIDVKIYPNTKHVVLTMYKNNDKRNFEVHNPFKFGEFRITELDELGLIIEKKKNSSVKDLMTSLGKRYERLKKIPKELRIQSALPALVPGQVASQFSRRKRKHRKLEPDIKVPGLEFNRSLPDGVPFVNNMVIEEPKYGIFFTDVFGDQAFQR
nr:hypothetical protein [Tanacetum cinerariifolium]